MKNVLIFVFVLIFSEAVFSQTPPKQAVTAQQTDSKTIVSPIKSSLQPKTQTVSAVKVSTSSASSVKVLPDQKKKEEQKSDEEYSEVLTDSMEVDSYSYDYGAQNAVEPEPDINSIPYSYGQFKTVMNENGKNIFIFEGKDGTIYFLNISFDKAGTATWKLLSELKRS